MRLIIASALCFSFSALSFDYMPGLPDGRYLGHGHYSDNCGNEDDYQAYTSISGNIMHSDYAWEDGDISLTLAFWWQGEGYFAVAYDDHIVGDGRCIGFTCEYDIAFGDFEVHEAFIFTERHFVRVGHKTVDGCSVHWEEKLRLLDLNLDEEPPMSGVAPGEPEEPVVTLPVEAP